MYGQCIIENHYVLAVDPSKNNQVNRFRSKN